MARRAQDVYAEWRGGTCRVKWWTGDYHANGRKRFESKGGFTDEEEAYSHGLDQMSDIRHGTHVSNRDGSTLMSDWLDDWIASLDHAHGTEKRYRSNIESHIRPYFKGKTVADIDLILYRAFKKHIHSIKAPNTASQIVILLGMILDDAVPKLIQSSPVERKRKRGKHVKRVRERKRDVSADVVEQLARNAETIIGRSGYALVWTMAMTGMRPGELFGLTKEYCYPNWPASDPRTDLEDEDRYEEDILRYGNGAGLLPAIRVERQVQYQDGNLTFCPPKYHSYRTLVIPPFLADLLKDLGASHNGNWVFSSVEGGSLGSVNFTSYYWDQITDGAPERKGQRVRRPRPKVPEVPVFKGKRFYLLRHAHKAWLDEDGHSRFAVEARMGHEVQGVEGVYSNMTVAMERAVMRTLQERWELLEREGRA